MIQLRGYEGCQQRVAELLALLGENSNSSSNPVNGVGNQAPPSMSGSLSGASSDKTKSGMHAFGQALDKASGALAPLDPSTAGTNIVPAGGMSLPQLKSMAVASAGKYGVDPAVFQALIQTESDFNPRLVSGVGATGLAQLMPKTAESLGVTDIFDPAQNLDAGAKYFAQLMKQFNGDPKLALAAYNAGPGAVVRAKGIPPFQETQDYVHKVLARADEIKGR